MPIWLLCCLRTLFKGYFYGDEKTVKEIERSLREEYKAVFKNMVCYGPGDTIYERNLSIGGGRGQRERFANMGFYKFDNRDLYYNKPVRGKSRPENEIMTDLRKELLEDDRLIINNRQFVELICNNRGIKGYNYLDDESYRIFIFSSCGAANCTGLKNSRKFSYARPYNTALCNRRIDIIEKQQSLQNLKLMELGINTGIGGSGFGNDEGDTVIYSKENNTLKKWATRVNRKKAGATRRRRY